MQYFPFPSYNTYLKKKTCNYTFYKPLHSNAIKTTVITKNPLECFLFSRNEAEKHDAITCFSLNDKYN
jgi:hypothetical protein